MDFGFTPEVLNRNFDLLDIDPTRINGLILSHGHRDHYGGLAGFIGQHRTRMPSDLALFVGEEGLRPTVVRQVILDAVGHGVEIEGIGALALRNRTLGAI